MLLFTYLLTEKLKTITNKPESIKPTRENVHKGDETETEKERSDCFETGILRQET